MLVMLPVTPGLAQAFQGTQPLPADCSLWCLVLLIPNKCPPRHTVYQLLLPEKAAYDSKGTLREQELNFCSDFVM